jgi:hypothetical protein
MNLNKPIDCLIVRTIKTLSSNTKVDMENEQNELKQARKKF